MDYYEEEVAKYRKKKQKNVKKSDHKHIYKPDHFVHSIPILSMSGKESVMTMYYNKCTLCGKLKWADKMFFSKEEFEDLVAEMNADVAQR